MSTKTLTRTHTIDPATLRRTLEATLARFDMTLEEFVEAGEDDTLTEDELRDLWLSLSIVAKRLVNA